MAIAPERSHCVANRNELAPPRSHMGSISKVSHLDALTARPQPRQKLGRSAAAASLDPAARWAPRFVDAQPHRAPTFAERSVRAPMPSYSTYLTLSAAAQLVIDDLTTTRVSHRMCRLPSIVVSKPPSSSPALLNVSRAKEGTAPSVGDIPDLYDTDAHRRA